MDSLPTTLLQAVKYFADFEHCRTFMLDLRWPDGKVACPHCDSEHVVYLEKARVPEAEIPPGFGAGEENFHTYEALVTRVVDGDTFHARITAGFGIVVDQRVRLKRIDAPEINTEEGAEAKALLEKILARDGGRVLLQTFGVDQHGRSLANVWVQGKSVDQEILDADLAIPMEN